MSINPHDLMSRAAYAACRRQLQPGLIAHRRRRTVTLGEYLRVQFEDEMTLRYQIQEVLRAERIDTYCDIREEVDAYAHLMPDGTSWRATLLIECPDAKTRIRELPSLDRAVRHLYVEVPGLPRAFVRANDDIGDADERPSGVHFLRFPLSDDIRTALLEGAPARLGCAHPHHLMATTIAMETLASLRCGLTRPETADVAPQRKEFA